MPLTSSLVEALCRAFPPLYLDETGTRTVEGASCIHVPGKGFAWFLSGEAAPISLGSARFEEVRSRLGLLPDMDHIPTREAIKRLVADRTSMNPAAGLLWLPATKEKRVIGWTLRGGSRAITFPSAINDPVLGLLDTVAKTICTCGRTMKARCPVHGTQGRWWR